LGGWDHDPGSGRGVTVTSLKWQDNIKTGIRETGSEDMNFKLTHAWSNGELL